MPLTASAVIAGVSAVGKVGVGIAELLHSKHKPVRPVFDIQKEYFDNRDIAARQAASGLTDKSLDFYGDQAGRGLSQTTSAILQAGGGVNAAAGAYDTYLQGTRSIAAEDSQLQQKNIMAFLDRNDTLAKQKVQKWVLDKYEPYKDQAKANAQEKSAGIQNVFGGLAEGTAGLAAYSQQSAYEDMLDRTTGNGGGNGGQPWEKNVKWGTGPQTPEEVAAELEANRRSIFGENKTTRYSTKTSAEYSDFQDPFEVPDITTRQAQVQKQVAATGFDPTIFSDELQDYYKRLYNFN